MEEDVAKTVLKTLRAYLNDVLPLDPGFIRELDHRDLLASDKAPMLVALADKGDRRCIHQLITYMEQFYTEEMLLKFCVFLKEYAQLARPRLAVIASRIKQEISKHKPQLAPPVPEVTLRRSAIVRDDKMGKPSPSRRGPPRNGNSASKRGKSNIDKMGKPSPSKRGPPRNGNSASKRGKSNIVTQDEFEAMPHALTDEEVDQLKQFKVKEGSVVWMMVGITGNGKSCTGNFILGERNIFPESSRIISETERAALKCSSFDNENLCVIDTPGLGDTRHIGRSQSDSNDLAHDYSSLATELTKVMMMMDHGINAFLIVVRADQKDYRGLIALLDFCDIIGKYWDHSILVVTHGKELGKNEEEQKAEFHAVLAHPKGPAPLKKVHDRVSRRLVIAESKDWRDRPEYHRSVVGKIMKYSKEITERHGPFQDEVQSIGRVAREKAKLELRNEFENFESSEAQKAIYQSTFKHVKTVIHKLVSIKLAEGEDIDKLRQMSVLKEEELDKIHRLTDLFQKEFQDEKRLRKEAEEKLKQAEIDRVLAEEKRKNAEVERDSAIAQKQEADKNREEADRKKEIADEDRRAAELQSERAEGVRRVAEQQRDSAEGKRLSALREKIAAVKKIKAIRQELQKAEREKTVSDQQRQNAEKDMEEARNQAIIAEKSRVAAVKQKEKANKDMAVAGNQRDIAERNRAASVEQKERAEIAKITAEQEAEKADEDRRVAEQKMEKAEREKENAEMEADKQKKARAEVEQKKEILLKWGKEEEKKNLFQRIVSRAKLPDRFREEV